MYKHTYNTKPSDGQHFSKPSETIQGQSLSVSQMIQRYNAGIPILGTFMEYPEDETEFQPLHKDLTDFDEMSQIISSTQMRLDEARKAYAIAKAEKEKENEAKVALDHAAGAAPGA